MRITPRNQDRVEVSMAPMIDAVFLLLIFFLVATMMKKEDKDIDISPPQSISAIRKLADDQALVIGMDRAGAIYLEGEKASTNLLHSKLREVSEKEPGRQIRIDADAETPFHRVIEVMNLCQFRELSNVVIRTYDEKYNRR